MFHGQVKFAVRTSDPDNEQLTFSCPLFGSCHMEYYEKEPDGAAKSLLALSSFLKGESDLAECIMSCHRIMAGV